MTPTTPNHHDIRLTGKTSEIVNYRAISPTTRCMFNEFLFLQRYGLSISILFMSAQNFSSLSFFQFFLLLPPIRLFNSLLIFAFDVYTPTSHSSVSNKTFFFFKNFQFCSNELAFTWACLPITMMHTSRPLTRSKVLYVLIIVNHSCLSFSSRSASCDPLITLLQRYLIAAILFCFSSSDNLHFASSATQQWMSNDEFPAKGFANPATRQCTN